MKKIICFLAFLVLINTGIAFGVEKTFDGNVTSRRLHEGTNLRLKLLNRLDTDVIRAGQEFQASLCDDIKVNGKLMLPKGTVVRGTVNELKDKGRPSKSAVMYMKFDHIVTPSGRQLPLRASILSSDHTLTYDGGIDGGGTYSDEFKRTSQKSGKNMKNIVNWGKTSGDFANGYGKILTYPVAYIGAGISGPCYLIGDSFCDLFRKGYPAVVEKGEIIEILLTRPIDIPTY